ncbi:MAG: cation:proton antiporter [Gammaproteobacteria bacterium]|nr:cation:proton antiporter [Gammaproteobacteria bacterium]
MNIATVVVVVVVIGMAAQLLAGRLRFPAILPLIVFGVLAGPVFGIIRPHEQFGNALEPLVGLAVALILFEGGLRLRLHELRHASSGLNRLVYAGVPLAFLFGTLVAHYVGGIGWPLSTVFGAISVVTGPTVVLPLLRHSMLKRRIASTLRWEAIVNDPIGALLAVLTVQFWLIQVNGGTVWTIVGHLASAVAVGVALGMGVAWLFSRVLLRGWIPEYLKQPITFALVLSVYVLANLVLPQAGLLAVTLMGITLGNLGLSVVEEMRRFKEYVSTLMLAIIFILLSAKLDPQALMNMHWVIWLVVPVMLFIIRPLIILLVMPGAKLNWRERLVAAWAAPRGVVAAATGGVLAPSLLAAGYADAVALEPLMFALVFVSVVLQGSTLAPFARRLGQAAHSRDRLLIIGASPWSTAFAKAVMDVGGDVLVVDNVWHRLRSPRLAGVPVFYGEILSDKAEATLELTDVGTLLATTANDAYNALVCASFAPELGHENVFQLPMHSGDEKDPRGLTRTRRGQIAFSEEAGYEMLYQRIIQQWRFQKTPFSESFGYADFKEQSDPQSMPVLLQRGGGSLWVCAAKGNLEPKPGDVLLSFVPPKPVVPQKSGNGNGNQDESS